MPFDQAQVFLHGQPRPHSASLRHERYTSAGDLVGPRPRQVSAAQDDAPGGRPHQSHDRHDQRGLARAVAAQHGQRLAALDVEVDAVQHIGAPITRAQITYSEKH
jgi:hypothetical protein